MFFLYGRLKVYKAFKEGQKRILVATDLVGRGIDIERVNIVINYDMPETDERHGNGADTYLHRVRFPPVDSLFSAQTLWLVIFLCGKASFNALWLPATVFFPCERAVFPSWDKKFLLP